MIMMAFQLCGLALMALFFGALISNDRRATDR
jgi:hypothetical protein